MQKNRIFEKAIRLGISIDDTLSDEEKLLQIANSIGLNNIDDLNTLENRLDNNLSEQIYSDFGNNEDYLNSNDEIENLQNNYSFGEKEYNKTLNENGVHDNNYYKNRQEELDNNVKELKEEKDRDYKKTDDEPVKEDGSNNVGKNKFDKVKDDINLLNARKSQLQNKIDNVKSKAYEATHPEEILNNKVNEVKENVKDKIKEKTTDKVKDASKKVAITGAKKLGAFIISNPVILGAILILILVLFIVIFIGGAVSSDSINSTAYDDACGQISLQSTSLSKSEFIERATNYYNSRGVLSPSETIFLNNLDTIYDMSVKNNINPELVIVRAELEGYSPGPSRNNFWGITCYNEGGINVCGNYDTFDEGLLHFLNYLNNYEDFNDFADRWAYLGEVWYKDVNDWGIGGCIYLEYIKDYMSTERYNIVKLACSNTSCISAKDPECLKTNDEDDKAYMQFQIDKMVNVRRNVFALEPGVCEEKNYNNNCTIFAQGDPRWKNILIGKSSVSMGNSGCAITSIAIGISCYTNNILISNFDAGKFLKILNNGNCFNGANISWNCEAIRKVVPTLKVLKDVPLDGSNSNKFNKIHEYINSSNRNFGVVHISSNCRKNNSGHWMIYDKQISSSKFNAMDPAVGDIKDHDIGCIDRMIVYTY